MGRHSKEQIDKTHVYGRRHVEKARARIKVGQIMRRLQEHILGMPRKDPATGEVKIYFSTMTMTQMRAAEILLSRAVPTLQALDITLDGQIAQRGVIAGKPITEEEWEREAAAYLEAAGRAASTSH